MAPRDLYVPPPAWEDPRANGVSRRALLGLDRTRYGRAAADHAAVTDRVRTAWDDTARLPFLRALEPVAEIVADAAEVGPGDAVLDVGAGDGNVVLACTRRGATVDACDLAPTLLRLGRERAPDARWIEADAEHLPHQSAAYDVVTSAFGTALAPRPGRTVRQLARVCRPGGRLVLTAWVPRGLPGRLPELLEVDEPLPDGVPSPAAWGREDVVRRRLAGLFDDLEVRTRTVRLAFASPEACFAALVPATNGSEAIRDRFDRLLASVNSRPPRVEVDARYLLVRARRSGG